MINPCRETNTANCICKPGSLRVNVKVEVFEPLQPYAQDPIPSKNCHILHFNNDEFLTPLPSVFSSVTLSCQSPTWGVLSVFYAGIFIFCILQESA